MMAATSSPITTVLDTNSTEKFFIEYRGFLSNHLSHGIIALHRLSANEARINKFIQWYIPRLEPSTADEKKTSDGDFDSLKGKRVSYYKIVKHFEDLLKTKYKSLDEMLSVEFPKISLGMAGSALHGAIHLGYGYAARNNRLVSEGLAYIYYSYRPVVTSEPMCWKDSFGKGQVDILDVLSSVADNIAIRDAMVEGVTQERWLAVADGQFQRRVSYLLTIHGDDIANYVNSVKVPADALTDTGAIDAHALARKVLYWSIVVYTLSENKNDFFLLHGVTCAWSVLQLVPVLNESDKVKVIWEFLAVLVGVYIAQFTPALNVPLEEHSGSWDDLVKTAVKEDRDEHCYKLVQVCCEMARDPADGEDPNMLKQAAWSALNNEFYFRP